MAKQSNQLRTEPGPGAEASKKKSKKKERKPLFWFLKDDRFIKVAGLFLLLFSIYLLFAFISYFVTWFSEYKDDVFSNVSWKRILTDSSLNVQNWTGRLGAALSQKFIKDWFGASAFLGALWTLLAGIRLTFGQALLPMGKTFRITLVLMLWFPTLFGLIYGLDDTYSILGGTFGYESSMWLTGFAGKPGAIMILIFVISALVVLAGFIKFKDKKGQSEEPPLVDFSRNSGNLPAEDRYNTVEFAVNDDQLKNENLADDRKIADIPVNHTKNNDINNVELTIEPAIEEKTQADLKNYHGSLDVPFDPTLELSGYQRPPLSLLNDYGKETTSFAKEELLENKDRIVQTLNHYQIKIDSIKATVGPTVTLYEIVPAPGIKISKIKNLEDDIALSLSALGIRIIAPIPGKGTIGIEVANKQPETVSIKSLLSSEKFQNSTFELPIALGKTITNESFIADLTKMPHILMAGATGQGKSVGLNGVITSLLFKKHPSQLKFILVDPKKVELSLFSKIERHFLAKLPDTEEAIITDTRQVVRTLNSLCIEMDHRYELLKDAQVRNIKEYNDKFTSRLLNPNEGHEFLPYLVLVVDEFADLIMTAGKEIENPLTRLAQLARATGIHLIIATQRPSVNIITGTIKANFPARIAFRVISKVDSRTILDSSGADQLVGRGDMLLSTGNDLIRLQCAYIDIAEIDSVTDFIGSQRAYPTAHNLPEFSEEQDGGPIDFDPNDRDPLFDEAARIIVVHQQGSTSLLQRKLKLGYNRAGRIIDQLEAAGIVGSFEGSKARDVLITNEMALEQFLKDINQKGLK